MRPMPPSAPSPLPPPGERPLWQRLLWLGFGLVCLATGIVGIFLPLLPTTPFLLLTAFGFARSSTRCERWLLTHPRFGPIIEDWRRYRAVPLRAKQLSALTMVIGCTWAAFTMPPRVAWLPTVFCLIVGTWLWRLPTRQPTPR